MSGDGLQKKVFSGLIWKFGERIGAQAVSFLVSMILARLLLPADYGAPFKAYAAFTKDFQAARKEGLRRWIRKK